MDRFRSFSYSFISSWCFLFMHLVKYSHPEPIDPFAHWLELINEQRTREYHSVSDFFVLLILSWPLSLALTLTCVLITLCGWMNALQLHAVVVVPLPLFAHLSLAACNVEWCSSYSTLAPWCCPWWIGQKLTVGKLIGWTATDWGVERTKRKEGEPLTSTNNMANGTNHLLTLSQRIKWAKRGNSRLSCSFSRLNLAPGPKGTRGDKVRPGT